MLDSVVMMNDDDTTSSQSHTHRTMTPTPTYERGLGARIDVSYLWERMGDLGTHMNLPISSLVIYTSRPFLSRKSQKETVLKLHLNVKDFRHES